MWWLLLAVLLAAIELFTVAFVAGLIAVAAAIAAVAAATGAPVPVQWVVLAVVSATGLGVVRPFAKRALDHGADDEIRTNADLLIGKEALVVDPVDRDNGRVKISGEVWTARPVEAADHFDTGIRLTVVRIDGAIAIVSQSPQGAL